MTPQSAARLPIVNSNVTTMTNIAQLPTITSADSSNNESIALLAGILKASGDPLRLEVLRVLQQGSYGVLELSQLFDVRQSGMSHHLKVLSKAGLAEPQREGNSIFYRRPIRRDEEVSSALIQSIFEYIDLLPLRGELATRVAEIQQQRSELSQAFFSRYAESFKEQQELIADYEQYAQPTLDMVLSGCPAPRSSALEIGPGEGAFLAELAPRFQQVYALDNAGSMLDKAQTFARQNKLDNIEFVLGETEQLITRQLQVDAIVLNMVLHHIADPSTTIADCARLLKTSGILVVCDLCHHDQTWVRENCGDLWLGFNSEVLDNWCTQVGLEQEDELYLGLRNGFQIQIRRFRKPV